MENSAFMREYDNLHAVYLERVEKLNDIEEGFKAF